MKARRHPRERDRLRTLRAFEILDTEPDPLFDELVGLATELLDVPTALVSLVDERRQWFKARVGLERHETSLEESFCAHAILGDGLLVVEDANDDPRFADNPLVADAASPAEAVRFYAGVPLVTREGLPLGTLCVLDYRPRRFGDRERRRLALLGDQAMALLERHHLQREAERQNRLKSHFLAHVSHEIRTPLAAVLGYAELLDGKLGHADDRAIVRTILRNGDHLRSLVDELLDLSRIEAGQLEIHHAPCALAPLLSDIDSLMRGRALEKGLAWRIDCPDALPVRILTDALRLRQILVNLVGNALKFTERGEVVLEVTSEAEEDGAARLAFAVRDTGIGMSDEQLAHVFSPFSQAEADTATRFGGSGLGLTISRDLARLLDGELRVESEPGVGSVFRLRLPCEPVGADRRVPSLRPVSAASGEIDTTALVDRRLLVVDDRDDVRRLAERTLERAGAEVTAVAGGVRALERLREGAVAGARSFDAMVLDLQMPGLDGFGVLEAMAEERLDVPVIALTADALGGQRERCIAAGCRAYVSKPFAADDLVRTVAALFAPETPADSSDVPAEASARSRTGEGYRVLVVDDSRDLADALARLLERHGYETAVAGTAEAALALAARVLPHCVLLDRELPDMSSPRLLALLREREELGETRFVSLSGSAMSDAERVAFGFDLHLCKPVTLKTLLGAIESLREPAAALTSP